MMKICDLHSHVLPGVDHGAENMETALQMLSNAVASEVECLALTPHFGTSEMPLPQLMAQMQTQFQALQQASAHLPIQLALGAEVHVCRAVLDQLDTLRLPTINGSRYLLTEFPILFKAHQFEPVLEALLDRGYIPLIAHPERYVAVTHEPWIVSQWLDMGCHIQITGGSVLGHYGKTVQKNAAELLHYDMVACIASDAHGLHERTNYLMGVYDHLSVQFSRQYAQCMLCTNPMRIWRDENI